MAGDRQQPADPRFAVWIGGTVALFLAAVAVGFVLLPLAQPGSAALDLWGVICRAVGVPNRGEGFKDSVPGQPSSTVAWTESTRHMLADGSAGTGAALATTCVDCHGETGASSDAAFPDLAGHSVAAIYKQLQDFTTGDRNAAVMGPYLESLSQQDMVDLATHFAELPGRPPNGGAAAASAYPAAHRLAEFGDPVRGIAGCGACHTPGHMEGAPPLEGQQRAYFEQQMQAFKAGTRHNDIGAKMRIVAQQLTQTEIAELAVYFSDFDIGEGQ
jgi:cytochrome c553